MENVCILFVPGLWSGEQGGDSPPETSHHGRLPPPSPVLHCCTALCSPSPIIHSAFPFQCCTAKGTLPFPSATLQCFAPRMQHTAHCTLHSTLHHALHCTSTPFIMLHCTLPKLRCALPNAHSAPFREMGRCLLGHQHQFMKISCKMQCNALNHII